jgi:hypothetical protein
MRKVLHTLQPVAGSQVRMSWFQTLTISEEDILQIVVTLMAGYIPPTGLDGRLHETMGFENKPLR